MSNETLERFCFRVCGNDFKGVFSADYIPLFLAAKSRFVIIANLGARRGVRTELPVGHFVTIAALPDVILYIDSYGLPSVEPNINKFLKICRRPVQFNLRQIQTYDSVYCSFYAMMFTCFVDKFVFRDSMPAIRVPKLRFEKRNLKKNDELCVKYLKRILWKIK